ncbi:MAG: hypothetical protein HY427_03485 [Candidatus Levybacteria bacterium]|nr:hypothetical protein [Candidatus Levybacteria bacterium]
MPDAHKNFAYSTVLTAPSPANTGTSLVVQSGDGTKFPTVPFNATVWPTGVQPLTTNAEIVRVTAISTDTFTITRAQESSTARSIVVGDQIAATITAKTLTDAEGATTALDNLASVAINTSLISDTDSTDNLGSTTVAWANLYVDTISSITGNPLALTPIAGTNLNITLSTTGDFAVNTDDLYVDTSTGRVGINTTSPTHLLNIVYTSTGPVFVAQISDSGTGAGNGALLQLINTDTTDGNRSNFTFNTYDAAGTNFATSRIVGVHVSHGTSATSGALVFQTRPSTSTPAERMRIDENGNVGIGTAAPTATLHVDQSSTTAAVPPLILDQADIDQDMIEFVTTIGTGNAIEAIGAKTLTTTHFIKVTIPGGLTRYFPVGTIA